MSRSRHDPCNHKEFSQKHANILTDWLALHELNYFVQNRRVEHLQKLQASATSQMETAKLV